MLKRICDASSEFVSSSIPSWQILTAHAQPFRGARDLVFCLKVPLDTLLVWASSGGSGETARMRRLAWTFAACIGDKYQIRLTRPIWYPAYLDLWDTIYFSFKIYTCPKIKRKTQGYMNSKKADERIFNKKGDFRMGTTAPHTWTQGKEHADHQVHWWGFT